MGISDDEFVFARDFDARKFDGRRTGLCTELLRAGRTITVDDTWRGNPEAGVAGVMRRRGYRVFYAENTLWRCLFGLLFWMHFLRLASCTAASTGCRTASKIGASRACSQMKLKGSFRARFTIRAHTAPARHRGKMG